MSSSKHLVLIARFISSTIKNSKTKFQVNKNFLDFFCDNLARYLHKDLNHYNIQYLRYSHPTDHDHQPHSAIAGWQQTRLRDRNQNRPCPRMIFQVGCCTCSQESEKTVPSSHLDHLSVLNRNGRMVGMRRRVLRFPNEYSLFEDAFMLIWRGLSIRISATTPNMHDIPPTDHPKMFRELRDWKQNSSEMNHGILQQLLMLKNCPLNSPVRPRLLPTRT